MNRLVSRSVLKRVIAGGKCGRYASPSAVAGIRALTPLDADASASATPVVPAHGLMLIGWRRVMSTAAEHSLASAVVEKDEKSSGVATGKVEKGDLMVSSYWGISRPKIIREDGTEWPWNCFMPWETYRADLSIDLGKHHVPTTLIDKVAYRTVKLLRIPTDVFFQECFSYFHQKHASSALVIATFVLFIMCWKMFPYHTSFLRYSGQHCFCRPSDMPTLVNPPKYTNYTCFYAPYTPNINATVIRLTFYSRVGDDYIKYTLINSIPAMILMDALEILKRISYSLVHLLDEDHILVSSHRRYGCRAMMLETVAAVPGMVGGMLLHLRSLRKFQQSGGWIKALLEEAENERMHLMTMVELVNPKWYERLLVLTVQGVFFNAFFVLYMMSPKLAHRIVGYLEEEAIHSYTEYLKDIESGAIENVPAPAIAIDYWRLPKDAKLHDVITVIRADEAHHRDVNHFASVSFLGCPDLYRCL
ncbi:hypothetical protein OROGR_004278 [Orobanche gracilis]